MPLPSANGHESVQIAGDSEGQVSLACCSPWGHKESDMTQQLNNNNTNEKKPGIMILILNTAGLKVRKVLGIKKGNT